MIMNRRKFLYYFMGIPMNSALMGCGESDPKDFNDMSKLEWLAYVAKRALEGENPHLKRMPPRLSIDEIGWQAFLRRWSAESTELSRAIVFQYGFHAGRWSDEKHRQDEEQYLQKMETDLGVVVPRELYFGGMAYPPTDAAGRRRKDEILQQVKAMVAAASSKRSQAEIQEWGARDYNGIDYVEYNAFAYAALLGEQMFSPATEEDIAAAEKRLGVSLPASYKDFLRVSNGFWLGRSNCLMPVQKIGKLGDLDVFYEEWVAEPPPAEERLQCVPKNYYQYGEDGLTPRDDNKLEWCGYKLQKALLLSDFRNTDGLDTQVGILPFEPGLNVPGIREDEWEAFWHFAPRALSFKHLMEYIYRHNIAMEREYLVRRGQPW